MPCLLKQQGKCYALYLISLVCCELECPVGTGSEPCSVRLCVAGPRKGLDMKIVVGVNPGFTRPGFRPTLVKSLNGDTASPSTGWNAAYALLSEEVQHPMHVLGVPYLAIQNL